MREFIYYYMIIYTIFISIVAVLKDKQKYLFSLILIGLFPIINHLKNVYMLIIDIDVKYIYLTIYKFSIVILICSIIFNLYITFFKKKNKQ